MENPETTSGERGGGSLERLVSQQRGFWRSPRGENHGLNSKPGDEWAHEGDIHDTDRLRWLVDNITEEIAVMMPDDFGHARQYIDELMLANDRAQQQPPELSVKGKESAQ